MISGWPTVKRLLRAKAVVSGSLCPAARLAAPKQATGRLATAATPTVNLPRLTPLLFRPDTVFSSLLSVKAPATDCQRDMPGIATGQHAAIIAGTTSRTRRPERARMEQGGLAGRSRQEL
jgi:hypothetical protein